MRVLFRFDFVCLLACMYVCLLVCFAFTAYGHKCNYIVASIITVPGKVSLTSTNGSVGVLFSLTNAIIICIGGKSPTPPTSYRIKERTYRTQVTSITCNHLLNNSYCMHPDNCRLLSLQRVSVNKYKQLTCYIFFEHNLKA